jgi:hypothetical protein
MHEQYDHSIAYVGPALDGGRMDAILLADGLKGIGRLIAKVADLQGLGLGRVRLQVQGQPRSGSLEVFLHFLHVAAETTQNVLDSKVLTEIGLVMGISGFTIKDAKNSLIALFKKFKGRPIDDETNLDDVDVGDLSITKADLIRMYNDPDVQAAIRAALRPLRDEGVTEFQTRERGQVVERVTKSELAAADAAELDAMITDETKVLDVEKASFVPHLSWHVSDQGRPFDAKIEDPELWAHVAAGERFGSGDRLHVDLHTEAERESSGRLRITRTITKVHRVERAGEDQMELF